MWFWLANNSFKPASIKYISKVVHPKYLRGFYKYLLCLKKSSGELLWSAHCIWHQLPSPVTRMQRPVESVPAMMGNLCRCTPDICELRVGCWEQGGWDTHDAKRVGVGNHCHSTPVIELMTRHRHFSKGKFIKPWTGEAGNGGSDQRAGGHAMGHLPCSLMFSKIQGYYAGLYVCYNIPDMKFTILTILSI